METYIRRELEAINDEEDVILRELELRDREPVALQSRLLSLRWRRLWLLYLLELAPAIRATVRAGKRARLIS